MDTDLLEQILGCPSLPTLPAVAVRVLELTGNPEVSLDELAATIQKDQGLSAKVLRTVNSSFYGVRKKCTTINGALVLLGLSTVKSVALGFSLVPALSGEDEGFDYVAYWRRGLYTAVSARLTAREAHQWFEDEAFVAGLLQDMGMIAMRRSLGARYADVLREAAGRHPDLVHVEDRLLEVNHAEVGALLAARWRLPDALAVPIRYHERPTAAPAEWAGITRCVALGNLVHDVLTDKKPGSAHKRLRERAREWFALDAEAVRGIVRNAAKAVRELSSLFAMDTGRYPDAEAVLREAERQLLELARAGAGADPRSPTGIDAILIDSRTVDPLTGVLKREAFDLAIRSAIDAAGARGGPVTLLQVQIDGHAELAAARGQAAGDEVLIASVALLRKHFGALGAVICRWSEETFAVVVEGVAPAATMAAAREFGADLERSSPPWSSAGLRSDRGRESRAAITCSIGAASIDKTAAGAYKRVDQLVAAAAKAVATSRAEGGNRVRAFVRRRAA